MGTAIATSISNFILMVAILYKSWRQKKIEIADDLDQVSKLIDRLPEKERMIIQLREIEQYGFDEIAEILELPEGTIRVYLSRIRKKLRKQFVEIQNYGA